MERAELTVGPVEVRGSGAIHRFLSFLGAFFLGIGPAAARAKESENWWDREEPPAGDAGPVRMVLGHQEEMFDAAGQVAVPWADRAPAPEAPAPAAPEAPAVRQTIVSVRPRSRATGRTIVTTRVEAPVRVSAVATTPATALGVMARQLVVSQSISSGKEEARWFSVPQRALLPRFQLFEGSDAVTEDGGSLTIASPATRPQRGKVWFV